MMIQSMGIIENKIDKMIMMMTTDVITTNRGYDDNTMTIICSNTMII